MALVKTIESGYQLYKELKSADITRFTICGCEALVDYYEDYLEEFDAVALNCTFSEEEPRTVYDYYHNYDEIDECYDEETEMIDDEKMVEALNRYTWARLLENGNILYENF